MTKKLVLVWGLLVWCVVSTQAMQVSSYTINGAATHTVVAQSDNGRDMVYIGEIDGTLTPVASINALVTQGYQIATPSLSYDARTIFFSAKAPSKADFDLYTISFTKGKWGVPRLLDKLVNSAADELSPSFSADGQILYFVRRVAADPAIRHAEPTHTIYQSKVDEKGRFGAPSAILISLGEDYSVSVLPDNTTLLLTSQRPIEGERPKVPYLYYSKRLSNDNWTDPTVITLHEDQRFIPSSPTYNARRHTLYYIATTTDKKPTIRRDSVGVPTGDFILPIHHVTGVVRSTETNQPIVAQISISNIMTNSKLAAQAHDDGYYALAIPQGVNTVIDFTAPQCSHQYLRMNTQALKEDMYATFDCSLSHQIELTFRLYDRFILEPIEANLRITDFQQRPYRDIAIEKLNATSYRAVLPLGQAYRLQFTKEGYLPTIISLAANREIQFNRSQLDIELSPFTKKTHFEVVDAITHERIEAEIEIANRQLPERLLLHVPAAGALDTVLRASARYVVNTSARGYLYDYLTIDMQTIDDNHTFTIALNPITQGAIVQLPDVNFEYNSAEIMLSSLPSLEQVLRLLETNPEVRIELAAHTDDRGNERYNLTLSQQRAASVRDYLVGKGIDPARLQAVGYGKTNPLVPNTSDENRAKNRRVEFIIR